MTEYEDQNLVKSCLSGNKRAFEMLVEKYQKPVFNIAYRMSNNFDDSEDITQSVFIKVYEKLHTFNEHFKFFSWIYRIAINEALNHLKRKQGFQELDAQFISNEKNPDEAYNDFELRERIHNALMHLAPEYRILIILKHYQDFSYRELSYILDIPEKTVKSRLFTARLLLKDVLINKGVR